jgi:hypothetical protein
MQSAPFAHLHCASASVAQVSLMPYPPLCGGDALGRLLQWHHRLLIITHWTIDNQMKDIFIKWFMSINSLLLRISHGRVGSRLGTQTILVLHTIGRKSGRDRAIPIACFDRSGRLDVTIKRE